MPSRQPVVDACQAHESPSTGTAHTTCGIRVQFGRADRASAVRLAGELESQPSARQLLDS